MLVTAFVTLIGCDSGTDFVVLIKLLINWLDNI